MGSSRKLTWAGWFLMFMTILVTAAATCPIGILLSGLFQRPEDKPALTLYLVMFVVAIGVAVYLAGKGVFRTLRIAVVREVKKADAENDPGSGA